MNLKQLTTAIDILLKYYDDQDGYFLDAEHDIIYFYPTDRPVTLEDQEALKALGLHQENVGGDEYESDEGWAAWV